VQSPKNGDRALPLDERACIVVDIQQQADQILVFLTSGRLSYYLTQSPSLIVYMRTTSARKAPKPCMIRQRY
jgi:hypothetical protein